VTKGVPQISKVHNFQKLLPSFTIKNTSKIISIKTVKCNFKSFWIKFELNFKKIKISPENMFENYDEIDSNDYISQNHLLNCVRKN
jgi:hypothetical protein